MMNYTLDLRFGFGEIGIDTYQGYVAPHTDVQGGFQLETGPPETTLENTFPIIVDIDFSRSRAEMGFPGPHGAAASWQQEAKEYVIDYIGQKSSAGDALGAIENGVSIAEVVESESYSAPPEINVDLDPKTPPRITFKMGEIRGDLTRGHLKVEASDKPVTLEYHRAKVKIFMDKHPFISIKAVPLGKNIDTWI